MLSKRDGPLIAHRCLALCGHVLEKSSFQEEGAYHESAAQGVFALNSSLSYDIL